MNNFKKGAKIISETDKNKPEQCGKNEKIRENNIENA
jgi:hypothetical protein